MAKREPNWEDTFSHTDMGTDTHRHTHTDTHTHTHTDNTDAIDVLTPLNVLYCSFLQYSSSRGGLSIRAIGATHCLGKKKKKKKKPECETHIPCNAVTER